MEDCHAVCLRALSTTAVLMPSPGMEKGVPSELTRRTIELLAVGPLTVERSEPAVVSVR